MYVDRFRRPRQGVGVSAMIPAIRRVGVLALGVVVMATGVIVRVTAPQPSFGWTAYAPLSDTSYNPNLPYQLANVGNVLIVAGVVLVAGWVGFTLARRRRRETAA